MKWFSKLTAFRDTPSVPPPAVVVLPGIGRLAVARSINCLGAMCPRPQLLAAKVLGQLRVGEVLEVVSDNPGAVESFPALVEAMACSYVTTVREDGYWRLYLRKDFEPLAA